MDEPAHLAEVFRLADQQHLELSVVHVDERAVVVQHAADRHRIAERAEHVLAGIRAVVRLHGHRARFKRRDVADALQHVGEVPEQPRHAARRRIRALRERAERGDVREVAVVEAPGVDCHVAARRQHAAHAADAARQLQRAREVVRRARRDIGDRQVRPGAEHAVDDGVQRAVAADAEDPPASGQRGRRSVVRAVLLGRRLAPDDRHAGVVQMRFQQVGVQPPLRAARAGVDHQQGAAFARKDFAFTAHRCASPFAPGRKAGPGLHKIPFLL